VDAGGACNCFVLTVNPHCHGTHTESIGHLTRQRESVWATGVHRDPVLAQLVTVQAVHGTDSAENSYTPTIQPGDWIIPIHEFKRLKLLPHIQGLVVRVAGAPASSAPFFSHEAMRWIVEQGIEHLLVELPSVDRSEDDGLLSNHRIFWKLAPQAREASANSRARCTITELIELPADLPDGLYGIIIQLPPLSGDALPSTVYLLPAKATSSPLP
jgi:kynurenine formamidase